MSAQIHRFHDKVAIWVGTGETVYLTQPQAAQLAIALAAHAEDIAEKPYLSSTLKTFEMETD